jgi:uncharacterized protein
MLEGKMNQSVELGPWIETYTRKRIYYWNITEDVISIQDIAHALALTCRFGGHSDFFYSVAQHSVLVSYICEKQHALYGLLHDAAETYLMDVPHSLKNLLAGYTQFEQNLMEVISKKFGLDVRLFAEVKKADNQLLATEARDVMGVPNAVERWGLPEKPLVDPIIPWSWESAEERFLRRFKQLTREQA